MNTETINAANQTKAAFFLLVNHPLKLKFYLLAKLPAAFFSGLRVVTANEERCIVSVPYSKFTKNPFRSTYFACLGMAAELSTGILAMANTKGVKPSVSMLITGMEARFYKKAVDTTFFTCNDGSLVEQSILRLLSAGSTENITLRSEGKNSKNELIAEFWFTWSFKVRSS